MKKLAELWEVEDENQKSIRCKVCAHYCIIKPGKRGFCQTRENFDGILYSLVYGSLINRGSVDPIEKKPLYHFWPGSNAYSIATIGCNFRCQHCQNWEISQCFPDEEGTNANFFKKDESRARSFSLSHFKPEEIVRYAEKTSSTSIAYTYNEPTIMFEFIRDTALLAREKNIKNVLVTNGFSSPEANVEYIKFIDAVNIDFKAFSDRFYKDIVGVPKMAPVLATAKLFKENGVHVEITNLIIPEENDNLEEIREMTKWIFQNLGKDTPLHFSAYHPSYRMDKPRTSPKIMLDALTIAQQEGLENIFLGNVMADKGNHSICPHCGAILIHRQGYYTQNENLGVDGTCKNCGEKADIKGIYVEATRSRFFL